MNKITSENDLTPVEKHSNLLFKRDDLFIPYEENGVNGGKLRQAIKLLENIDNKHIYTYSSLSAPSAPSIAAACKNLGLLCTVYYGGTNIKSALKNHMVRLTNYYEAYMDFSCKTGRQSALHHAVSQHSADDEFIVKYEDNVLNYQEAILLSNAYQVQNLPDNLSNLVITSGSGITAAGIIIGIEQYHKNVENIVLITTAPDRIDRINNIIKQYNIIRQFTIIDLYHSEGFNYDKRQPFTFDNIILHPQYEAKTLKAFLNSDLTKENSLFWIVGSEPTLDLTFN